jgi:hypothetical protein
MHGLQRHRSPDDRASLYVGEQHRATPLLSAPALGARRSVSIRGGWDVADRQTLSAGKASISGSAASVPLSCSRSERSTCHAELVLSVVETVSRGKVIAVTAKAVARKPQKKTVVLATHSPLKARLAHDRFQDACVDRHLQAPQDKAMSESLALPVRAGCEQIPLRALRAKSRSPTTANERRS